MTNFIVTYQNRPYEQNLAKTPKFVKIDTTINLIIANKLSLVRFGDGEFSLLLGRGISFQSYSPQIQQRLKEVLQSDDDKILVGIPNVFGSLEHLVKDYAYHDFTPRLFWRKHMVEYRSKIYQFINFDKEYHNAFISRPFLSWKENLAKQKFDALKCIWEKRNIIFIEGVQSRLGFKNDLFLNANLIKRILCPVKNAFSSYNKILATGKKYIGEDDLVIIALGPTATILAYDLAKLGYQALDMGHIDIEYEWFKQATRLKPQIEGKFTNEAKNKSEVSAIIDDEYKKQIIAVVE